MNNVKITDIKVTLCDTRVKGNFADSTRQVETIGFAVVEVETNVGITGIGVTYHEVGGEAIREFIRHAIKPKFIGRNPFETEALYKETFHYMRGVGRKGLAFCAYSAVDIALWDIKGKVLNMPLFRLLGGNDPVVPIYASGGWTSYSIEELVDEAKMMVARGYKKIKLKVGVDGGRNPMEDVRRVAPCARQSVPTSASCWTPTTSGEPVPPSNLPTTSAIITSNSSRSPSLPMTSLDWRSSSAALTYLWLPVSTNIPATAFAICC